jgi:hypothetical protein
VRNLPGAFATGARHPVVSGSKARLDRQQDLEHGGRDLVDVLALRQVPGGRRIVRIESGSVVDEWDGPHLESALALSSPRSTPEIGSRGLEVRLYRGELAVVGVDERRIRRLRPTSKHLSLLPFAAV